MKYVFGTLIAVACGVSLAAQSSTQTPAGQSTANPSQSVTVTGCLVATPQTTATAAQPGQPGGFMVTGVAQTGAVWPQSNPMATSYVLSGGNPSDLRTYSNTRVEIQGTIQPAGAAGQTGTAGVTPTATLPAGTPPTATPPAGTPPPPTPPAGTPPTATPPTATPPTSTPPAGTPPTATAPGSTPPSAMPPAGTSPTTPSPTGTTGTGTGSATAATGQVPMQQLQVTSVRQVPGMCGGGH